ncbi:MAG: bifunctional precorrin-2 dehydrogenase/sirohydrochlorin ferrochelatase [Dehalococcoidia bacterium]|nr:MAG: bifunctional precorrin-2 dehydrogenase/sirohydrochlorin ferrochelatase [Dehalococcoidia bacterium]
MGYYPIFLELENVPVLLVGGGHVALEKIGRLVDSGARVTLVAPELIPTVRAYADAGRVRWLPRPFMDGDTGGQRFVFVATDNGEVNRRVADEARAAGILVNAADDVDNCDFILPSVVRKGSIQIASSTAGTSPAMARWLRERLTEFLNDDIDILATLLGEIRREVRVGDRECAGRCERAQTPPPLLCDICPNRVPADRWQEAIDGEVMRQIAARDLDGARARLMHNLHRDALVASPTWRKAAQ